MQPHLQNFMNTFLAFDCYLVRLWVHTVVPTKKTNAAIYGELFETTPKDIFTWEVLFH